MNKNLFSKALNNPLSMAGFIIIVAVFLLAMLAPLIAPGMVAHLWGYNGQSPGPTIECVEGDKVRIFVTNKLPEHTTIHWHGQILPLITRFFGAPM